MFVVLNAALTTEASRARRTYMSFLPVVVSRSRSRRWVVVAMQTTADMTPPTPAKKNHEIARK